ncbi:hypothetical protein ACP70R_030021 [Stipagrostis hirtigluma subsp. patula]
MLRAAAATAARRRISLVQARSAHAEALVQPQAVPARPGSARSALEAAWVPLYTRLVTLPPRRPPGRVAAELDSWLRQRRPLSEEQILAYVRQLRKFNHGACALELMDWMEARGAKLNLGHHALRLDLISKVHGVQAAEEYFWSLPDMFKSVKTYSSLLNCYVEHRMADKGLELYEKMKAMNFGPSTLVFNNLLSLYQKTGQPEKIPLTFKQMQERGVRADNFTYFLLIESYMTMNDLDSAEKFLEELQKVAPVHWSLYTTMANNYIKHGQFGKVEVALKKAEDVMNKGDVAAWHYLLSIYARCGNSSEVKRIWRSLKCAFNKCLNKSYLVMLSALRTLDDFDFLQLTFQEWQSSHQYYDMRIANVVIAAYLDKGMIDEAEAIRHSAMAQGHCNHGTFNIFAEFYLDKGKVEAALEIMRDTKNMVRKHNWLPSREILNRFLKHYEEAKDVDGMESLCECLKNLGCLDAEAYEALMRTYISAGRTNPSIAQRIEDDGIHIEAEMAKLLKSVSGS